jgi:hypothetical protein
LPQIFNHYEVPLALADRVGRTSFLLDNQHVDRLATVSDGLLQFVGFEPFTAQADDKDSRNIGMRSHGSQGPCRQLQVITDLCATDRVTEGNCAVDLPGNLFDHIISPEYGGDDGNMGANTHSSIGATISHDYPVSHTTISLIYRII